jgi:hypothetical protein
MVAAERTAACCPAAPFVWPPYALVGRASSGSQAALGQAKLAGLLIDKYELTNKTASVDFDRLSVEEMAMLEQGMEVLRPLFAKAGLLPEPDRMNWMNPKDHRIFDEIIASLMKATPEECARFAEIYFKVKEMRERSTLLRNGEESKLHWSGPVRTICEWSATCPLNSRIDVRCGVIVPDHWVMTASGLKRLVKVEK